MTLNLDPDRIVDELREAGIAGAGGAGFPSHSKWGPDRLLVNHQESEPGYYIDKWLGEEYAQEFAELFQAFIDEGVFDLIVVGAKEKDKKWSQRLIKATGATVYGPGDLPIDADEEDGIVFTFTADSYNFGKEKALLAMATGTNVGEDLPMDHNWLVHNTETLYNLYNRLADGTPVTRKFVHVYGDAPEHRFLDVPVGTPIEPLLEAAGTSLDEVQAEGKVLADGGPGWCFEIADPEAFGVRKRTNAILVLDGDTVDEVRQGGPQSRIDVLHNGDYDWDHEDPETEPTTLDVDRVHVPLISNPGFAGLVAPSTPLVDEGDEVDVGDKIADVSDEGTFSEVQHASIDGTVTQVDRGEEDGFVHIER